MARWISENIWVSLVLGLAFFVAGLFTLPHYGINWDTINHLPRGQAYLHYFLTGREDFSDLPPYFTEWQKSGEWYWQNPESLSIDADVPVSRVPRRSLYQNSELDFGYFMKYDGYGHPPLSDVLSSGFNVVLFSGLRWVNDIDAYRVYGVLLAAVLVGLVFWWTASNYGKFAGLVAVVSLALYPLFWSESHFNTEKDIPETVYWSFLIFCVYKSVTEGKQRWMWLAGVFFGLALGTKFNVLFAGLVILPWMVVYFLARKEKLKLDKVVRLLFSSIGAGLLGVVIFVASWPYLWADPVGRVLRVFKFYRDIGTTVSFDGRFLGPLGINTYAVWWITYTTPIVVLALFLLGLVFIARRVKSDKNKLLWLFLFWFLVPIVRVTWPGMTVYGGVRQIMEFVPALAVISGLGGLWVRNLLVGRLKVPKLVAGALILAGFIPITVKLIQIHPNENVYFNGLIGGLSGARAADMPSWGHSFGAAYRQAVVWINKNAERNADLVYAYELIPNIPRIFLRTDIDLHNSQRSGYLRQGEYAITLTYQGTEKRSYYDAYLENFLVPVYEAGVDGVPIVKVWKNSSEQVKDERGEKVVKGVKWQKTAYGIRFDLGQAESISRLEVDYEEGECRRLASGYVQISEDGREWERLPGVLPDDWRVAVLGEQPKNGKFIEPFVGQQARYIDIAISPDDACLYRVKSYSVFVFSSEV